MADKSIPPTGNERPEFRKTQGDAKQPTDQLQTFRLPEGSDKKAGPGPTNTYVADSQPNSTSSVDVSHLLGVSPQEVVPTAVRGIYGPQAPASSDQTVASQPALRPEGSRVASGFSADDSSTRPVSTPTNKALTVDGAPSKVVPGNSDRVTPGFLGPTSSPVTSEVRPAVASGPRTTEAVTFQPREAAGNPVLKVGDSSNVRTPVDSPAAAPTKSSVFTFTTNDNGQVSVTRQPQKASETAPGVQNPSVDRSLPSSLAQDGGQQKPFVAPETQPRLNLPGEQSVGQNQTRSITPERVDGSASAPKGNTSGSVENANLTRPNLGSLENQNQVKPSNLTADAQTRTAPGVAPDAGSRDLAGRDGLTRTNVGGNALDSQGRQIPVAGAEKLPLGLDNKQAPGDAASARLGGPQTPLDIQGKQTAGNASNDAFGTRREAGLQLPDTKQTSGRTDSGLQLPDTKQSSGRTDTGGTKLPDARNDTGRNDANTSKLPDAKTLANLDQKFGDKLNPPGKGGGVPIAIPGIPDILGGLRGDKDSKTGKDAKADSQGAKDGGVRSEAPGGRDAKDAKGESQGSKDSKVVNGKGDTKSGADDKSIAGQKGVRSESDSTTKGPDGKAVQDVRNTTQDTKAGADGRSVDGKSADGRGQGGSNLVHDGGTKSEGFGDRGAADKGSGLGDGKTRVDQPGARVIDADGKLIGGRPETGSTIKTDIGDKGHTDVGGKAIGPRGDGPFVLPPGSLPVPDLVGGIKNIGQQIDLRTGKPIPSDDKGIRQPDKVDGTKADINKADAGKIDTTKGDATKGDANKLDPGKGIAGKTDTTKGDPVKGDGGKVDPKGMIVDGVKTIVTGGLRPGDKPTVPGEGKVVDGVKSTGVDGVKTTATDGVKTIVTGGVAAGDGVKNAVAGGAKGADGVKVVGVSDTSADGKQIAGKNPVGTKFDGAIIVPPAAVPLTEMIGNLKGIAARIFPPESRTGRPDPFDNFLPGRKTEKLEDRTPSTLGAGVRAESTIPIVRAIGERIGKSDEQFIIKAPQNVLDANKANQSKVDAAVALPPWIAPEHAVPDKSLPGLKAVDANAAKPTDAKSTKNDVLSNVAKAGDHQVPHADKHDQVVHDEAAERLLVNLELVGSPESAPAVESEEEEVFPLAAIEYFGGEFERAISGEEDVMFDGDGTVVEDDEQSTRYQYIVEAGDTVELIAIKVFKNVTLAPLIYEINKEAIPIGMQDGRMVFTLKVGTVIWLPFPKEVKAYMGT